MQSNAERFLYGQSATDPRNLALKMFYGEVLEAFQAHTVFYDNTGILISFKQIDSGKSWQFPMVGEMPAPEYHVPGTELLGQQIALDEGLITIDDILVSHLDVPFIDEQLSHFDIRGPFSRKIGKALAIDADAKLCRTGLLAARTAAVSGIHSGGQVVTRTAASLAAAYPVSTTGVSNFEDDLEDMAKLFDEDHVPDDDRYCYISPYIRRVLQKDKTIFSKDYSNGRMDHNARVLGELAGFQLIKTTQIPSTNITTGPTKYQGDFSVGGGARQPAAVCIRSGAIGAVQAGGMHAVILPDERRNTTFMKAQWLWGCGPLEIWNAGEIGVHT